MRTLPILAAALLLPAVAAAQAPGAKQPSHQEQVALRDYTTALMNEAIVGECDAQRYSGGGQLRQAYAKWRAPREVSIATGGQLALTRYPSLGGSAAAQRSNFRKQFETSLKPGIDAAPERACAAALATLSTGLPIPFSGTTRTTAELRFDIYKQAIVAGSAASNCLEFDAIEASVTEASATDTGATERWVLKGCGQEVALSVKHQPSAKGGSDFVISMAPAAAP
ncbi:hypothetical protein [Lysobacter silvisoli]|uniref:DUF1311 domain-containing protein n=1 Tax=Lysobacter silvisoli TaxID=2293254 RepID=A0A371JXJ2_9GAMM|nr:hypothetical protein [Lysobacter silvisoli]RDZ26354.1 hypothetical protein DX914_15215 [Lysobacter silvisoli]